MWEFLNSIHDLALQRRMKVHSYQYYICEIRVIRGLLSYKIVDDLKVQ